MRDGTKNQQYPYLARHTVGTGQIGTVTGCVAYSSMLCCALWFCQLCWRLASKWQQAALLAMVSIWPVPTVAPGQLTRVSVCNSIYKQVNREWYILTHQVPAEMGGWSVRIYPVIVIR